MDRTLTSCHLRLVLRMMILKYFASFRYIIWVFIEIAYVWPLGIELIFDRVQNIV